MIPISEFLKVTGISGKELLYLLETGQIDFLKNENGVLEICEESVSPKTFLACTGLKERTLDDDVTKEKIASVITEQLTDLIDEAMKLALGWSQQEEDQINSE